MGRYERILVPTDGSEETRQAVEHAIDLAAEHDATVHALYVVDTQAVDYSTTREVRQAVETELRTAGEEATAAVADLAADRDVTVEQTVLAGTPYREILNYADEIDADLIVMETHGRTGLDRVLIGSVRKSPWRFSSQSDRRAV